MRRRLMVCERSVQPRSIGGRPHRMDTQFAHQGKDSRVIVNVVQVVQEHVEPTAWIALAQGLEGLADVDDALVLGEDALQTIAVHVVETQELPGAPEFHCQIKRLTAPIS